jgi:hypothetical protein
MKALLSPPTYSKAMQFYGDPIIHIQIHRGQKYTLFSRHMVSLLVNMTPHIAAEI